MTNSARESGLFHDARDPEGHFGAPEWVVVISSVDEEISLSHLLRPVFMHHKPSSMLLFILLILLRQVFMLNLKDCTIINHSP